MINAIKTIKETSDIQCFICLNKFCAYKLTYIINYYQSHTLLSRLNFFPCELTWLKKRFIEIMNGFDLQTELVLDYVWIISWVRMNELTGIQALI